MNQIKPIQTIYNGYKFRSRLEARWAVFFDKAEIPYIYEPEGFYLPSGPYLPDFYLPWFNAYVEIKPKTLMENEPLKNTAERKLIELGELTGELPIICFGDPMDNEMFVFCTVYDDFIEPHKITKWFRGAFYEGAEWSICNGIVSGGRHWVSIGIDALTLGDDFSIRRESGDDFCGFDRMRMTYFRNDYKEAKEAARQARFEHGDSPIIKRSTFK